MSYITNLWAFSLALLLAAPALNARFALGELLYLIPMGLIASKAFFLHVLAEHSFWLRLASFRIYLIVFAAILFAFVVGNFEQVNLFYSVALNGVMVLIILLYPWREPDIEAFFVSMALISAVLSIHTILYLGNDVSILYASDEVRRGYLSVSVVIGFGCIASLYLAINKLSVFSGSLLFICWVGEALGRGRGALALSIIVSALYFLYMLTRSHESMSKSRKLGVVLLFAALVPVAAQQFLSLGYNTSRWGRMLEDFGNELEIGGRGPVMLEAMSKISQSPLVGNGLGEYMMRDGHPHNMVLQFGVDGGFVAMSLIVFFILRIIFLGGRVVLNSNGKYVNLGCAIFSFFVFSIGNYLKSGDAYLGREWFITSALVLVSYFIYLSGEYKYSAD